MTSALLSLVQWMSPAFPTGAFAYSHGLEQAIAMGEVSDEAGLSQWLRDILHHGAGWNDAVLLGLGLQGHALEDLDAHARALSASAERLRETLEQGTAFAKAQAQMNGTDEPAEVALPVAVAQAARGMDLPREEIIALFLHSFASNLVSCAVRFVPLGQAQGQRVLAGLHPDIAQIAAKASHAGLEDLAGAAFRADLGSMLHETLDVRIFKT
ncbi:urease accessory UreF family protein [Thioclava litoralis]|uniref:Urease accessory protein UreF n=1 Tax=Thioclava litoralis TaxID=3076557 RepID=A0ABZ1E4M7_9RHOB|nr:urease accessory UreF family protein [Thioclava sp. FTW29]